MQSEVETIRRRVEQVFTTLSYLDAAAAAALFVLGIIHGDFLELAAALILVNLSVGAVWMWAMTVGDDDDRQWK